MFAVNRDPAAASGARWCGKSLPAHTHSFDPFFNVLLDLAKRFFERRPRIRCLFHKIAILFQGFVGIAFGANSGSSGFPSWDRVLF
jgi:hypothetical protein